VLASVFTGKSKLKGPSIPSSLSLLPIVLAKHIDLDISKTNPATGDTLNPSRGRCLMCHESCPDRTPAERTIPDCGKEPKPASHKVPIDNEIMPEAIIGNAGLIQFLLAS